MDRIQPGRLAKELKFGTGTGVCECKSQMQLDKLTFPRNFLPAALICNESQIAIFINDVVFLRMSVPINVLT